MKPKSTHKNKIINQKNKLNTECQHFKNFPEDNLNILSINLSETNSYNFNIKEISDKLKKFKNFKNINLISDTELSKRELISTISSVDLTILLITDFICEEKLKFVKNFLSSTYIICYSDNSNENFSKIKKAEVRKFVKGNFNKPNILNLKQLPLMLKNLKLIDKNLNTNFLAENVTFLENNLLKVSGFVRNKFCSDKIILNNFYEFEVLECDDSAVFDEIDLNEYLKKYISHNKTEIESVSNESEESSNTEDSEISEDESINTDNFIIPTNLRENYHPLSFFEKSTQNSENVENLFLKKKSYEKQNFNKKVNFILKPLNSNLISEIKESNIFIFTTNLFDRLAISYKTIYNVYLNEKPKPQCAVLLNKFQEIYPLIFDFHRNKTNDIKKLKDTGDSISFIGNIQSDDFKNIKFLDIDNNNFLYKSKEVNNSNLVILEEREITGKLVRVYDKYAKIRMFGSKEESKFFLKNKVFAKNNKGIIKKSIGSKGLIKCLFERPPKYGEPIKMFVYRRIFNN